MALPLDPQPAPYDLAAFRALVGDVPLVDEPVILRKRSRDFFWYSPILNAELAGKSADIIAVPRHEADVIAVASACARLGIPLTPRGAGTGNYGQAVPLHGGVLIDMSGLAAIAWQRPGQVRVGPGAVMSDLDAALQPGGWELRMHPSTKRKATVGGFVAGGSGGVGSVGYGGLREPGNILAARIVTLEPEPRILELRGDAGWNWWSPSTRSTPPWRSATKRLWPTASSRSSSVRSPGRCHAISARSPRPARTA